MWKKRIAYCLLIVGLARLGLSLYSMIPPVFSQGSCQPQAFFVSSEHYEREFKKALEKDVDNIVNSTGAGNMSDLDRYIGCLLTEKEQQYSGFAERNKQAIEELRMVIKKEYLPNYTTLWNQSKWDDVGEKSGKRHIHRVISDLGNTKVKPLLDRLVYAQEEAS